MSSWDREPDYELQGTGLRPSCIENRLDGEELVQGRHGNYFCIEPANGPRVSADEAAMSAVADFSDFPPRPPSFHGCGDRSGDTEPVDPTAEKSVSGLGLSVSSVSGSGAFLVQKLLEVLPLRSKTPGKDAASALLPLPTSYSVITHLWPDVPEEVKQWVICVGLSLNSYWGVFVADDRQPTTCQIRALNSIREDVSRFCQLDLRLVGVDWDQFFMVRGIDYKGDEVRVARKVAWPNIAPALPKEVGLVPLEEVCTLGCREYVCSFDGFIKPREQWGKVTRPKVMVEDHAWAQLCTGLVEAGVCCFIEEEAVFDTGDGPFLNGLFGVSKEEWTEDGTEICRLIMNLIPLNSISEPLSGDVDTLPSWGMMNPFFLQPHENLLISSEDVKCFFYTMKVPQEWVKYLAFNKRVPDVCLPQHMKGGTIYLASRVLPMGFLNSVSLAQNVHRNLVKWSRLEGDRVHHEECELRKDRPFTVTSTAWRVYLDNYDLLEKVEATGMVELEGTTPPGVLALRSEYLHWQVPRNAKKGVVRSTHCELQGATVECVAGIAFPKETKLSKYYSLALRLLHQPVVSQRQMQVVCGGLVYFAMFRRPTLGALNAVWRFIESFNEGGPVHRALPVECRIEVLRFLGLLPLVRMNFRLGVHSMATCSDASSTGGGVCCSRGLTPAGQMAAQGELRGRLPRAVSEHSVLLVGLFDGIGALRVAMDLQGVQVAGYISVEKNPQARRVVEAHYPGVEHIEDVASLSFEEVKKWSLRYSQCSLVLIGAGPPCQGVSGLNTDRRGALKDERSCLFAHVPRVRDCVRLAFPWAQVHVLMESVSSMDAKDRDIMSSGFGGRPVHIDAGDMTWCHRPRLYWTTWDLVEEPGARLEAGAEVCSWHLQAQPCLSEMLMPGWKKVEPTKAFPTFTTSRPSAVPGRKPAGLNQCSDMALQRWHSDTHRFPPYQYQDVHCVVNRCEEMRIPNVQERELMLGFPLGYTSNCVAKNARKLGSTNDTRLTLLGNSWSVPVVAWLLNQLLRMLGLSVALNPGEIMERCRPGSAASLQERLVRLPLAHRRGCISGQGALAWKLANLISLKGEDILLTTPSTQMVRFHRLRASVPSRLWRWKVVTGWQWTRGKEHINSLEMRAILNAVRWRLEKQRHLGCRMLHLTDSSVCLHALTRGRTSSRKLRSTISRINALLLCSNSQMIWAYVATDSNPADKPSRWGRRVRSKYRNA